MSVNPTSAVGTSVPPAINRIAAITGSATASKAEDLQALTIDNYREMLSVFSGNPPEKLFIISYFEALERGKLPTAGIVQSKFKKGPVDIEELREVTNRVLRDFGYEGLEFFPKADKDLADVYAAFKRISGRSEASDITVEDISREAGKNLNYVTRILANKDCSRIASLDPSFARIAHNLCDQATDVQLTRMECADALERAHKWQVDPGSLDFAKEFIRESLGTRHGDDSLVTACENADQYAFMIQDELGKFLEPGKIISDARTFLDIRRTKLAKLAHALQEADGINEHTLKTAWCYSRVRGNSDKASTRALLDEIATQTGAETDLISLIGELKTLEKFTGREFSIDLFDQVKDEVAARARFAPKEYTRFKDVVYKGIIPKQSCQGLGITEDTVSHILETVIGTTEKDYRIYKICQELANGNNVIREEDLIPKLREAGIEVNKLQLSESLSAIERIFNERFTLSTINTTQSTVTANMLDQKARRVRGVPLDGHYRDPKARKRK